MRDKESVTLKLAESPKNLAAARPAESLAGDIAGRLEALDIV
jgi:hypothetical protein